MHNLTSIFRTAIVDDVGGYIWDRLRLIYVTHGPLLRSANCAKYAKLSSQLCTMNLVLDPFSSLFTGKCHSLLCI